MEIGTSDRGCGSESHLQQGMVEEELPPAGDRLAYRVGLTLEPEENLLGTLPSSLNTRKHDESGAAVQSAGQKPRGV